MDINHISEIDIHCISLATYTEANTQPLEAKLGVIFTIMNRVRSGKFGHDACDITFSKGQFIGIQNMIKTNEKNIDKKTLLRTKLLVIDTLLFKKYANPIGNTTYYFHDDSIDMQHIWKKNKAVKLGRIVFY
jgi:spore germination cell wall hydrolase CwlJ-like protein